MINKIKNNKEIITTLLLGYFILLSLELYSLVVLVTIMLGFLEFVVRSDKYKYLLEDIKKIT